MFITQGPARRKSSLGLTMDSLRVAADKLKKSPKAMKKKIDEALNKDSKEVSTSQM